MISEPLSTNSCMSGSTPDRILVEHNPLTAERANDRTGERAHDSVLSFEVLGKRCDAALDG